MEQPRVTFASSILASQASHHSHSNSCAPIRSRIPSAASFRRRVSTSRMERGQSAGNARASRGSTGTGILHVPWGTLFAALRSEMPKLSTLPVAPVMHHSMSQLSGVSAISAASFMGYDEDDPRLTGKEASIDPPTQKEAEAFILCLARALMKFGAPSHRIEAQLASVAASVQLNMRALHIPGLTIVSFGDHEQSSTTLHFVKTSTKVDLGKVVAVHALYKRVVHYEESVGKASELLKELLKRPPIYGNAKQVAFAIAAGLILSPMAYHGSVLDLLVAGLFCGIISWLQLYAATKNPMLSHLLDFMSAFFVAFLARGLSSLKQGIFCYSAIASTCVVKLLPKYLIICGSLDLASKQIIAGSVKLVYAIIWSLFLGFGLACGSVFYFIVDASSKHRRLQATDYKDGWSTVGAFFNDTSNTRGIFRFTNIITPAATPLYSPVGCYRSPDWPWYLQEPPTWTLFFLVPLFSVIIALIAYQPVRSRVLPVVVLVSCGSYAANRGTRLLLPEHYCLSATIGAFFIGTMAHLYSRLFHGTAFAVVYNAIGFLVPSGLAATGGLSQNYRGQRQSHYNSSLMLGLQMTHIAIGTTVGLLTSSLFVYSFGKKRRGALWAL